MTNARIASTFEQIATLLEQRGDDAHRVRAWREGAQAVRAHPRELADVFRDHGRTGLLAIPHIGPTVDQHDHRARAQRTLGCTRSTTR